MQKRILKGLVLAAASGFMTMNAQAIAEGFYMGLMMGPATNSAGNKPIQVLPLPTASAPKANVGASSPKSTQFGSRVFFGYKFNPYAGFEGGFTYFSTIKYVLKNPLLTPAGGTAARIRDIDFLGKLDYSYNNTIGFFGKAGVALAYTTTPGGLNITNYHVKPAPTKANPGATKIFNSGSNTYKSKLAPTFSIGISYDIDPSWQMDLSMNTILVGGATGNMTMYALGLSYHFVDRYCGQFLCAE